MNREASWFRYGTASLNPKERGFTVLTVCLFDDAERCEVDREIARGEFDRLVIWSGDIENLCFLSELLSGGPKRLLIQAGVRSLSGIERLTNLLEFRSDIASEGPMPSCETLSSLARCWLVWGRKYPTGGAEGIFSAPAISELTVRRWSHPGCEAFASLRCLEKLDLREGKLSSLLDCPPVRQLSVSYLPKLVDVKSPVLGSTLVRLHIEKCPIRDLAPVEECHSLQELHVEKVSGGFSDIDWVQRMPALRRIRLACSVSNINWTVLFNHPTLSDVALQAAPGYTVSDEEILSAASGARRTLVNFDRIGSRGVPAFTFDLQ